MFGAAVPDRVSETNANEALRAFLQLQEQLHANQLALEAVRKEAGEAAAKSAEDLAAIASGNARALEESSAALALRLKSIEESIGKHRDAELQTIQSSSRTMLFIAGAFAVLGIGAMVFMAFLQWRTIGRLAELSGAIPSRQTLGPLSDVKALGAGSLAATPQVQDVNGRLAAALDQLERRILSLEERARLPLQEFGASNGRGDRHNGHGPVQAPEPGSVGDLLSRGQTLMEEGDASKALELFEEAAEMAPLNPEIHVRKGSALEKLGKMEEAIASFDRAIEIDSSVTIAYLHKGGLLNRMERFAEALECYERALHSQEKQVA